jgi:hypothetical protein
MPLGREQFAAALQKKSARSAAGGGGQAEARFT